MRVRLIARGLAAASAAATLFTTVHASADVTKDQCIDADTQAQSLRREGRFHEARAQLRVCVDTGCPSIVRDDCAQRVDELERAQPTIVFAAKDTTGHDLTAVRVAMDGQPFAERLDGTALAADPGQHTFTFEVQGQPVVTQTYVLRESEKGRRETFTIGVAAPAPSPQHDQPAPPVRVEGEGIAPPAQRPTEAPPTARTGGLGGQKVAGLVVGGAGIVGIAVGSIFGAIASSSWSKAQGECSPGNCPSAAHALAATDHDSAVTAATISTVGFIAGGALLVGGIVVFLTAPRREEGTSTRAFTLVPNVGANGAAMSLHGSF